MSVSPLHLETKLVERLQTLGSCAVAFSGGVDSTVVAKGAALALGDKAVAVTGSSDSMAQGELEEARELARLIGIRHVEIATHEFDSADYTSNRSDRCYHCKTELYSQMSRRLGEWGVACIVNGANVDDFTDYRPGMQAANEQRIVSPLADCGFTKNDVRALAQAWNLPIWNKPATPCLSSRVAYGEEVTPDKLRMIDAAERFLRDRQFTQLRVRYHRGDLARLELPLAELPRLLDPALRADIVAELRRLGFKFIALDLEGFRSGSLNQLVQLAIV